MVQADAWEGGVLKQYVCGFVFSLDFREVMLIAKKRPEWQRGLLNGVGGSIEPGEGGRMAMSRECHEESGLLIPAEQWQAVALWVGPHVSVDFFYAQSGLLKHCVSTTDEQIGIYLVRDLQNLKTIPNLQWLIPLCVHFNDNIEGYQIKPLNITEYEVVAQP